MTGVKTFMNVLATVHFITGNSPMHILSRGAQIGLIFFLNSLKTLFFRFDFIWLKIKKMGSIPIEFFSLSHDTDPLFFSARNIFKYSFYPKVTKVGSRSGPPKGAIALGHLW